MKSLKFKILFVMLIMTIGIAAVTTNLITNGSTNIASNPDDFYVYFSDVNVNGIQDLSLVKKDTKLEINYDFSLVGERSVVIFEITNSSKNYDALVDISCDYDSSYLEIYHAMSEDVIRSRETLGGFIEIYLTKSYTGSNPIKQEINCTLTARATERTAQGSGTVAAPINPFYVGREITIGTEKFNIISDNGTTVSMLTQNNISDGGPYKQTSTQFNIPFSESSGWDYTPGSYDIDFWAWSSSTASLTDEYINYLYEEYGLNVSANLITISELGDLGCSIPEDYAVGIGGWNCNDSEHSDWLVNGQNWWTRSADSNNEGYIWIVIDAGNIFVTPSNENNGVRPVITIQKNELENYN